MTSNHSPEVTAMGTGSTTNTSSNGHPSWCIADHAGGLGWMHFSPSVMKAAALVRCYYSDDDHEPQVIQVSTPAGSIFAVPADADSLAQLVEALAGATVEEHNDLAAAIRQHAAMIAEEG